jgi:DNA adenine methylase
MLSDLNNHIIDCHIHVRDNPELLARYLQSHTRKNSPDYYYHIRRAYNKGRSSVAQAARFIYLNHTCFNGIFRVNLRGEFNVPYGHRNAPNFPSRNALIKASQTLSITKLTVAHFGDAIARPDTNDFYYLDPPYPPLNGTSFFTHYTPARFDEADQRQLADAVHLIDASGALFMMTNADVGLIHRLYREYNILRFSVPRWISCKHKKHRVHELLITNYEVSEKGREEIVSPKKV